MDATSEEPTAVQEATDVSVWLIVLTVLVVIAVVLAITAIILRFFPPMPKFDTALAMSQSATVNPTTSAVNTLTFNTIQKQSGISYNSSTGVFTVTVGGMLQVNATIRFTAGVTSSTVEMWIESGGTAYGSMQAATSQVDLSVSALIPMNIGDTFRVQIFPNTSISLATVSGTPAFPAASVAAAIVSA